MAIRILMTLILAVCSVSAFCQREYLKNWEYISEKDSVWRKCKVPSMVQENLIEEGILPDPNYRDNGKLIQWVSDYDWYYRTVIHAGKEQLLQSDRVILRFEGIDTYAGIFLNGSLIASSSNMFVPKSIDVTENLKEGENILVVKLYSPLRYAHGNYLSNGFNYPADNDHAQVHYSVFTRKAPYHYGWDWGMRMVGMGLWKDVYVEFQKKGDILNVSHDVILDLDKNPHECKIRTTVSTLLFSQGEAILEHTVKSPQNKTVFRIQKSITRSSNTDTSEIIINNPELWYPTGFGRQARYTISSTLKTKSGEIIKSVSQKTGIREAKLKMIPDSIGTSFYFEINKIPIYIKGVNYIPGELMLTKRDSSYFKRLWDDIEWANINMVRVWGGGVYEDEQFYEEADKRGILVWQDFMFACTAYPGDKQFKENVSKEAEYQVERLKKHPSVVLWCGNNENEEAIKYWGWQKRFTKEQYEEMKNNYNPLFRELLDSIVKTHNPGIDYIHSSPHSANWGRKESLKHGDTHYWGLWYGEQDFGIFNDITTRFVSEYGFQSFPPFKSIKSFAIEEDFDTESAVMKYHQKAVTGNSLIAKYMKRDYNVPSKFGDFVYASMILQARGMEKAAMILRSQRPKNMGQMYWQLNDTWPAVSWSSIDYYQNYKALHYTMRRAFAPVAILPIQKNDSISIYVSNDTPHVHKHCKLKYEIIDFKGKSLLKKEIKIGDIIANSGSKIICIPADMVNGTRQVLRTELISGKGKILDSKLYFTRKTKELELSECHLVTKVKCKDGEAEIYVKTNTLAKDVLLDLAWHGVRFSDNCFDLMPGENKKIIVKSDKIKAGMKTLPLEIKTMNDLR